MKNLCSVVTKVRQGRTATHSCLTNVSFVLKGRFESVNENPWGKKTGNA